MTHPHTTFDRKAEAIEKQAAREANAALCPLLGWTLLCLIASVALGYYTFQFLVRLTANELVAFIAAIAAHAALAFSVHCITVGCEQNDTRDRNVGILFGIIGVSILFYIGYARAAFLITEREYEPMRAWATSLAVFLLELLPGLLGYALARAYLQWRAKADNAIYFRQFTHSIVSEDNSPQRAWEDAIDRLDETIRDLDVRRPARDEIRGCENQRLMLIARRDTLEEGIPTRRYRPYGAPKTPQAGADGAAEQSQPFQPSLPGAPSRNGRILLNARADPSEE